MSTSNLAQDMAECLISYVDIYCLCKLCTLCIAPFWGLVDINWLALDRCIAVAWRADDATIRHDVIDM